ncbi:MAG: hypothetical protein Kow00108_22000 [Calditrichia bacterium]
MNIALLHYTCPPVVGGVEEILRQQASLFQRNYYPVKVLAGDGAQFAPGIDVEINPILSSRNTKVIKAHEALIQHHDPKPVHKLKNYIKTYLSASLKQFDVVIVHNVLTMAYNLPLTLALHELSESNQLKVVNWMHDSPYFYNHVASHLMEEPWTILKQVNPSIHYVTISEIRKKQFSQLLQTNDIEVIPNGIDPIQFWRLDPITVRIIREQNLFQADFLLVQPSRLHPRKNIELSVQVTRALKDKGINARFLLTGAYDPHEPKSVEYYKKLRQLMKSLHVENDVLIMAEYQFKSGEKLKSDRITIRDLYLISDVLFMPSFQEGFGIPLLEAGMIKMPIICSNIPPFREIGGEEVCFFEPDDSPDTIADLMIKFLSTEKSTIHFRKVMKEYIWDNIFFRKLEPWLHSIMQ